MPIITREIVDRHQNDNHPRRDRTAEEHEGPQQGHPNNDMIPTSHINKKSIPQMGFALTCVPTAQSANDLLHQLSPPVEVES